MVLHKAYGYAGQILRVNLSTNELIEEYAGRGVSYCATCDGAMFPDEVIAVVGGGDAAITEALHLVKFGSKVIVIHRRDKLRAGTFLREKAFAEPKMEFFWNTIIERIEGEQFLTTLHLKNVKTSEVSVLPVGALFVAIGLKPATDFLKEVVALDQSGFVITNQQMETDVPGIYAAGDIRSDSARQVSSAVGDGATAAINAEKYFIGYPP